MSEIWGTFTLGNLAEATADRLIACSTRRIFVSNKTFVFPLASGGVLWVERCYVRQ